MTDFTARGAEIPRDHTPFDRLADDLDKGMS
jgi:hypothetical protein